MRKLYVLTSLSLLGSVTVNACGGGGGQEFEVEDTIETLGEGDTWPSRFGGAIKGGGTQSGYHVFALEVGDDHYNVQTNPWGGADQTITAGGKNIFSVDEIIIPTGDRNTWDVAAYPSVYRGVDQGGSVSIDSKFPMAISDIESVRTGLKTNTTSIAFSGNTTYDVYFTHDRDLFRGPPDTFLMVWFDADKFNPITGTGDGYSCLSQPPRYVEACSTQGVVRIHDKLFYRFYGSNGHADVVSYVPESPFNTWEFDLKYFIEDSVNRGYLEADMYLQSIQAGFEMANGGKGLTIEDFYAHPVGKTAAPVGDGGAGGSN